MTAVVIVLLFYFIPIFIFGFLAYRTKEYATLGELLDALKDVHIFIPFVNILICIIAIFSCLYDYFKINELITKIRNIKLK